MIYQLSSCIKIAKLVLCGRKPVAKAPASHVPEVLHVPCCASHQYARSSAPVCTVCTQSARSLHTVCTQSAHPVYTNLHPVYTNLQFWELHKAGCAQRNAQRCPLTFAGVALALALTTLAALALAAVAHLFFATQSTSFTLTPLFLTPGVLPFCALDFWHWVVFEMTAWLAVDSIFFVCCDCR